MPVTTVSAAVHITPVALKTFFRHSKRKAKRLVDSEEDKIPQDDIFFDEAFNIVRAFIELGTKNTVESLQAFTNTHVPAPYWAAVAPTCIPLSSCNDAADILINWFQPDELKRVVGGERWWQVRGLDGIDAEWITQKDYLKDDIPLPKPKLSSSEQTILQMEHLDTVLLYVHGGGYFWDTHRFQIIRYARKIKGRAFAVNYRKAPQYPWPCPLQDVIASYLYLIRPPTSALHKPINPTNIVFAGDSAGGGLCLTALTVLRDLGLPLPAGAVLISPWVDLTHSFPSVMDNGHTDIIPPHGFLAKPSTLWPIDLIPPSEGRITDTKTNTPPKPGHADTLRPSVERQIIDQVQKDECSEPVQSQSEMMEHPDDSGRPEGIENNTDEDLQVEEEMQEEDRWQPKPPKVLMKDPEVVPLELRSQIQLYATTEQLTHPLVSPILQGSLADLPPLYILAGDGEVLRDEIIYLAHRCAFPDKYPVRSGALKDNPRQKENVNKFKTPTKVRLQVFDGMCHVLTVFTFTNQAKYAYRSIANFVKLATQGAENPFKELPKKIPHVKASPGSSSDSSSSSDEEYDEAEISDLTIRAESSKSPFMIRERVDIKGTIRPMESEDSLQALQMKENEIGIIKEAPVRRWLEGQEIWDKSFKRSAEKSLKRRQKIEEKYLKLLDHARQKGLILEKDAHEDGNYVKEGGKVEGEGEIQSDRRWGPLDLEQENPPKTAIAKRMDTPDALALLKKSIYHTAPVTHKTVPKLKVSDAIRAAFDPHDDPKRPPTQSVSEQQVKTHIIPIHGLKIWDALVGLFMKEASKKAAAAVDGVAKSAK